MILYKALVYLVLPLLISCNHDESPNKGKPDFENEIKQLVLKQNMSGLEYFFKVMKSNEVIEYKVAYLGDIYSKKDKNLKFVACTVFSGLYEDSKRANSTIYLYDDKYKLIGSYYVGGNFEALPVVAKNDLVLENKSEDCNQTTRISFKDSIPQMIFINCKKEKGKMFGDIYNFEIQK